MSTIGATYHNGVAAQICGGAQSVSRLFVFWICYRLGQILDNKTDCLFRYRLCLSLLVAAAKQQIDDLFSTV